MNDFNVSNVKASDKHLKDLTYTELILTIIIAWILIALFTRALDNFTFSVLHLKPESFFHTIVIALVVFIIFLIYIYNFKSVSFFLNDRFNTNNQIPIKNINSTTNKYIE